MALLAAIGRGDGAHRAALPTRWVLLPIVVAGSGNKAVKDGGSDRIWGLDAPPAAPEGPMRNGNETPNELEFA